RLPSLRMNRARDWSEFNTAVDSFGTPGQNVIFLDRSGNLGYRASGRGIKRSSPSDFIEDLNHRSWQGISAPSSRPRKLVEFDPKHKNFIATANERIWVDENRHAWAPDDRVRRINALLDQTDHATAGQMKDLFVDTHSLMHMKLRDFLIRFGAESDFGNGQKEEWLKWNGKAIDGKDVFTDLDYGLRIFDNILVGRVKDHFAGKEAVVPNYYHYMKRAWMARLLDDPDRVSLFGFSPNDLAVNVLRKINLKSRKNRKRYDIANTWKSQHPFVNNVPIIGNLFAVSEVPQTGFNNVVKVEAPKFGASTRLLFDLSDIHKSEWAFPVGQSGHFHFSGYTNFRDRFMQNIFVPMIPEHLKEKFK
ncbi:penicillin acylase family protein, partial [Oligoflexaceae bacterium]|nr:penicillin acylase family protein [Oligoflexaceae bacterium]